MGATLSTESVFTATVLVAAFAFGYHHYATSLSNGNTGYKRPNRSEENKLGPLVSPVSSTSSVRSTMPGQFDQTPNHSLSSKSKKSKKKKKSQCSGTELDTTLQPSTNLPPTSTRYSQPLQPSTVVSGDADGSRTHVIPGRKAEKKGDAGIMPPVTEGLPLDPETVSKHAVIVKRLSSKAPKTGVDELSRLGAWLYFMLTSVKKHASRTAATCSCDTSSSFTQRGTTTGLHVGQL